jgi:hypothetical protein
MTEPIDSEPSADPESSNEPRRRPLARRIGMAALALVLGVTFGIVAIAALAGGQPFLAAMGGIGALMVLWVGGLTLRG